MEPPRIFSFFFLLTIVVPVFYCDVKINKNRTFLPLANFSGAAFRWNFSIERTTVSAERMGKMCLKDVDKCIEEDGDHEATTSRLSSFLFDTLPPFDLSRIGDVSPSCRRHSARYVQDLKKFKLWAMKMYDSSAKLPSGVLNGNVNQFGDFDLCLQAQEKRIGVRGKYCLAAMQVEAGKASPYVLALHRLSQAHFHFKSELDDPGHRVPRFSSVNWALCVPSTCTSRDITLGLNHSLDAIVRGTDLQVKILVDENMCDTSAKPPMPSSTKTAICIFSAIVAFCILATIYDYNALGSKNDWIMCFSLRKNFNSLKQLKKSSDDIEAIHGIRFVNAYLLLLAHKSMAMIFNPYANRTEMVEFIARPWTVVGRAASLYTDPFILVSGTLTAYSFIGKLKKTGRINIFEEYISRLLRILPTFVALIAFCTYVLPWMNSGPMWNQVVTHHSHLCKKYGWRNLLFIHNYFGFNDMCLTHTHHVGIDTQLFFISPLLVMLLWKWPKKGAGILVALAIGSTIMRYYVTYTMKLSNYIHFGTSIKQLFATADNMYTLPPHRLTVYIMGIFLGYLLQNCKNITLSPGQLRIGSYTAFISYLISFFGPAFMGDINYVYDATDAAWYAAFSPILWCFAFSWIIFRAHVGYKGGFERFFSWPKFGYWTKISYTVYLIQFPVFFYNVGITRTSQHYGFFKVLFNLQEQVWVFFLAVILTLFVEMPSQNIRNIIFKKKEGEICHRKIKIR